MFARLFRKTSLVAAAGLVAVVVGAGVAVARGTATAAGVPALGTGVVDVETNLGLEGGAAAGTGMVLTSSGIVLTNNHVIRGATTVRVLVPSSGRTYSASVLGYSVAADVAVLRLQGASSLQTVTTARFARLRVGQAVTAVGNAGGARRLTLAPGRITGLARTITASDGQNGAERLTGLIETNTALQPGDSGGPLFDAAHRVVGMNTAASAGFVLTSSGDSYAIPINRALAIAKQVQAGKGSATVHVGGTPFIGVQLQSADGGQSGLVVAGLVPGAPADRAGLAAGDVITALDGTPVGSLSALAGLLLRKAPGDTVQVTYVDGAGAEQTATITLASGPPQ
jgi:S1-C subfamily serine protease